MLESESIHAVSAEQHTNLNVERDVSSPLEPSLEFLNFCCCWSQSPFLLDFLCRTMSFPQNRQQLFIHKARNFFRQGHWRNGIRSGGNLHCQKIT